MYDTYHFYDNILAKKRKNPRKHIVDMLRKHARASTVCGSGCFGFSMLCCCCCGPFGRTCVHVYDIGTYWTNAMQVYDGANQDKIDTLFEDAMKIIQKVHESYRKLRNEEEEKLKMLFEHGSELKHSIVNTNYQILKYFVAEDVWFQHFIDNMYGHARFKKGIKYVDLTESEKMILMLALPMFYPATQFVKNNVTTLSFDSRITFTIQSEIRLKYS